MGAQQAGLFFILLAFSAGVLSGYEVIGKVKAIECTGFVLESCEQRSVDAIMDGDGNLFHTSRSYEKVSSFDPHNGRVREGSCSIITKSKGRGLWSAAMNLATQPKFMEKVDGNWEEIDADYITFKCKKI